MRFLNEILCSRKIVLLRFFFFHFTGDHQYEICRKRVLQGKSVPHYAAIEPNGDGLMILSYKPFKSVQEEEKKLAGNDDAKTANEKKGKT